MARPRLTQLFPWMLPLRKKQRVLFYYMSMRFDKNQYAATLSNRFLPHPVFTTASTLYNDKTGFDMVYQENKVFNLKLVAKKINGLIIRPGEVFSFWQCARAADRDVPYKDGLVVRDGQLHAAYGGGLCQMSNLLFFIFLHSPLKIVERHGHDIKDFPEPTATAPKGVDATISEGWLDLKVQNTTNTTFQIKLEFEKEALTGTLLADENLNRFYAIENGEVRYYQVKNAIYEEAEIVQVIFHGASHARKETKVLYTNKCKIGYPLPEGTPVTVKG